MYVGQTDGYIELPFFIWYIPGAQGNPIVIDDITKEQGGISMRNREWIRFEHTGSVADYLAYSKSDWEHAGADTGRDAKESETRDGADHCAYRYGAGSYTHRGL